MAVAAMSLVACDRTGFTSRSHGSGTVTLVNRVSARVRVDNCSSCAAALEAALRRRLNIVDASVSLEHQTVELELPPRSPFASLSFREAGREAGAEVQSVDIEACGTIDLIDGQAWFNSGSARLLLAGSRRFTTGAEICVTGELQDLTQPPRLVPRGPAT